MTSRRNAGALIAWAAFESWYGHATFRARRLRKYEHVGVSSWTHLSPSHGSLTFWKIDDSERWVSRSPRLSSRRDVIRAADSMFAQIICYVFPQIRIFAHTQTHAEKHRGGRAHEDVCTRSPTAIDCLLNCAAAKRDRAEWISRVVESVWVNAWG